MRFGLHANPQGEVRISMALITSLRLSRGSPIPIKTILVRGVIGSKPFSGRGGMLKIWFMISEAVRLALKPNLPVAQK